MKKYYMNLKTGEVTYNHKQAVNWYREKIDVAICRESDGKIITVWEN